MCKTNERKKFNDLDFTETQVSQKKSFATTEAGSGSGGGGGLADDLRPSDPSSIPLGEQKQNNRQETGFVYNTKLNYAILVC